MTTLASRLRTLFTAVSRGLPFPGCDRLAAGTSFQHVDEDFPAGLVPFGPLRGQRRQLAGPRPALEVRDRAGVRGHDLQQLALTHRVERLFGLGNWHRTLGAAHV